MTATVADLADIFVKKHVARAPLTEAESEAIRADTQKRALRTVERTLGGASGMERLSKSTQGPRAVSLAERRLEINRAAEGHVYTISASTDLSLSALDERALLGSPGSVPSIALHEPALAEGDSVDVQMGLARVLVVTVNEGSGVFAIPDRFVFDGNSDLVADGDEGGPPPPTEAAPDLSTEDGRHDFSVANFPNYSTYSEELDNAVKCESLGLSYCDKQYTPVSFQPNPLKRNSNTAGLPSPSWGGAAVASDSHFVSTCTHTF